MKSSRDTLVADAAREVMLSNAATLEVRPNLSVRRQTDLEVEHESILNHDLSGPFGRQDTEVEL